MFLFLSHVLSSVQTDYKSLINYFLRERLYQHAADEAADQIRRRGNDTLLLYWKGAAQTTSTHTQNGSLTGPPRGSSYGSMPEPIPNST